MATTPPWSTPAARVFIGLDDGTEHSPLGDALGYVYGSGTTWRLAHWIHDAAYGPRGAGALGPHAAGAVAAFLGRLLSVERQTGLVNCSPTPRFIGVAEVVKKDGAMPLGCVATRLSGLRAASGTPFGVHAATYTPEAAALAAAADHDEDAKALLLPNLEPVAVAASSLALEDARLAGAPSDLFNERDYERYCAGLSLVAAAFPREAYAKSGGDAKGAAAALLARARALRGKGEGVWLEEQKCCAVFAKALVEAAKLRGGAASEARAAKWAPLAEDYAAVVQAFLRRGRGGGIEE
jgi:hypothetical protein